MTAVQLFLLMALPMYSVGPDGKVVNHHVTVNGVTGHVMNIQREDGSGHCFNVTMQLANGQKVTSFVRTSG